MTNLGWLIFIPHLNYYYYEQSNDLIKIYHLYFLKNVKLRITDQRMFIIINGVTVATINLITINNYKKVTTIIV